MKRLKITFLFFILYTLLFSQAITPFRLNQKWGYKQGETTIIEPQYDTAFAFDPTNRVAVVGKIKTVKISPASKETRKELVYNYIDPRNKQIYIKHDEGMDSVNEFVITRNLIHQYLSASNAFIVMYYGKKYLINKNGKQLAGMMDNIYPTNHSEFFICETKQSSGKNYLGLVDSKGQQIVPQQYSRIVINIKDSIIICCTAGIKLSGADDIYNFHGEKKSSSLKHLDYVYKTYTIYKSYEPEISYTILDNSDKKERSLKASWAYYMPNGIMLYKQGKDKYFFYNLKEDKKIPFDGRLYWFFNLNEYEN